MKLSIGYNKSTAGNRANLENDYFTHVEYKLHTAYLSLHIKSLLRNMADIRECLEEIKVKNEVAKKKCVKLSARIERLHMLNARYSKT